jgi:hypothetical protein
MCLTFKAKLVLIAISSKITYKIPEIEHYLKKIGVPTSNISTSFYYENFLSTGFGLVSWRDDKLVFTLSYPGNNFTLND